METAIKLKWTIKDRGLTQRQIAKKMGMRFQYLCDYLNGYRELTPEIAERIEKAMMELEVPSV
jgi:transcriptional regulator with XRE-family HTH domain